MLMLLRKNTHKKQLRKKKNYLIYLVAIKIFLLIIRRLKSTIFILFLPLNLEQHQKHNKLKWQKSLMNQLMELVINKDRVY